MRTRTLAVLVALASAACCGGLDTALASDAQDTPEVELNPWVDITDLYAFPGSDESRIAIALTLQSPISPAGVPAARFDPDALYQLKIDNTGDAREDVVMQFRFSRPSPSGQAVTMYGPAKPPTQGTRNTVLAGAPTLFGGTNTNLEAGGVRAFAGVRDDPFFLDVDQFLRILPDRRPSRGPLAQIGPAPEASAFRARCTGGAFNPGQAQFDQTHGCANDFVRTSNAMAIVVELPEAMLRATGNTIGIWATTSVGGETYEQIDRIGNPWTSTLYIDKREHGHHNVTGPVDDVAQFRGAIARFLTTVAGRDSAYANSVATTLTPDMLIVRTDKSGGGPNGANAGWLSYVLDPANGWGGRKLQGDDAVDKALGITFGNAFGNNNNVSPGLVTDNVDANDLPSSTTFPFVAGVLGGSPAPSDVDGDGDLDGADNCFENANADQADAGGDGRGDACDEDDDGDGLSDATETLIGTDPRKADTDGDGKADATDGCPTIAGVDGKGCVVAPAAAQPRPTQPPAPDLVKPTLRGLAVAPSAFASLRRGASIVPRGGTLVRFTVSEEARLTFTVERRRTGRRVGSRCRTGVRRGRRCTLLSAVRGSFATNAASGAGSVRFSGRVGGRRLGRGTYRITAVAADAAGNRSAPVRASFRVR